MQKRRKSFVQWLAKWTRNDTKNLETRPTFWNQTSKTVSEALRDYHTTVWLAHSIHNLREPQELVFSGHLSHQEYEELMDALHFIWSVRNWLHHLTGRKSDQLYFEYQTKVAEAMRIKKQNGQEPVEKFLGYLHGHMELIKQQHLMYLQRVAGKRNGLYVVKPRPKLTTAGLNAGK